MLPLVAGAATGLLLGAVGGGGSILLIPLLIVVFGLDAHAATGTALGVVAISAAVGSAMHARAGSVRVRQGVLFAAPGVLASAAMAPVNARLPEEFLVGAVVLLMVVVAVQMWRRPDSTGGRRSPVVVAVAGLAAGALTGLLGVGGGFVIVPALVLAVGLPMREAVGTSLVVIVANALAALPGYALRGDVDLRLTLVLAGGALAGVLTGSVVGRIAGERRLQQAFAGLLVVVAGVTAAHQMATGA